MASRVARLLSALIAGAAVAAVPSPATADIVRPEGTCTGSGSWQTGAFSELSTDLDRDDVIEVDRADKVQWKGTVVGPASGTTSTGSRASPSEPPPCASAWPTSACATAPIPAGWATTPPTSATGCGPGRRHRPGRPPTLKGDNPPSLVGDVRRGYIALAARLIGAILQHSSIPAAI